MQGDEVPAEVRVDRPVRPLVELRELAQEGAAMHSEEMPERQVCDGLLWALDELANASKAVEYYRAGIEQRAPKWVPARVWLAGPVRGDYPIGHTTIAHEGEYECESNRYGAISVVAENGKRLGVKPAEFDVVAWRENKA